MFLLDLFYAVEVLPKFLITSVVNSASDKWLISILFSSFSGVLICSIIWAMFLCLLILAVWRVPVFVSMC